VPGVNSLENMRLRYSIDVPQDVKSGDFRSQHPYAVAALTVTLIGIGSAVVLPAVTVGILGVIGFTPGGVAAGTFFPSSQVFPSCWTYAPLQEVSQRVCNRHYTEVRLEGCFLSFSVLAQQRWHLQSLRHLRGSERPRLERGSASPAVSERTPLHNHKTIRPSSGGLCTFNFCDPSVMYNTIRNFLESTCRRTEVELATPSK